MHRNDAKFVAVGAAAGMAFTAVGVAIGQSQAAQVALAAAPAAATAPAKRAALATKKYVNARLKTRAPARIKYGKPQPARTPDGNLIRAQADRTAPGIPSVASLAGTAVRSVVYRYRIPNRYGKGREDDMLTIAGPECPADAPIYVGWGVYSGNYRNGVRLDEPLGPINRDGTFAAWFGLVSKRANIMFGGKQEGYPKDGPLDLYLSQLCAPVLPPVSAG